MRIPNPIRIAASLAAVGALAGCPDREVSKVDPIQEKTELKEIPVNLNRDVDILFVIDNSGSMGEEQDSLVQNLPVFINVLEQIEGGLPNVHIAVVSSNMGVGPYNINGCTANGGRGDDGQFQATARPLPGQTCSPPQGAFIRDIKRPDGSRDRNYDGSLAETFRCIGRLGTTGCGFEQHLESMKRALECARTPGDFNNGFLRPDAYLAVIFLADEDDCSVTNPQMFDTSQNSPTDPLGALHSFRCFEFGVDCEVGNSNPRAQGPRQNCTPRANSPYMANVDAYAEFLRSLKPQDPRLLIVANIVGNPDPVAVGRDMQRPDVPALVPSCTSGAGNADPGVRLVAFGQQFPDRNTFTTICNEDLSDGLRLVAELMRAAIGNPCITGDLKDRNPSTPELDPECVVADVRNPGTDDEVETILPHCNADEDLDPTNTPNSTNIPCWHLARDTTNCSSYPTQLALVVERAGASVPSGTYVRAQCVTQ